ncbi:MAG: hypothetical protein ACLQVM_26780 [Terriglobia bacterium]
MSCPICNHRKVKRFCPAKGENICSVCCGTEREVTIDCPADCPHLVDSRKYDEGRRQVDWSKVPFADVRIPFEFAQSHTPLLMALISSIGEYVRDHRQVVDTDAIAALQALAETYRTLSSGLYYEKPPDYLYRRELYSALKEALEKYKQMEAQRLGLATTRDGEIRDALTFLTQLGATRENGRPKGRAFLDLIRAQLGPETLAIPASNIVLLS